MADEPSVFSVSEFRNFLLAVIVVTSGFVAFKHEYTVRAVLFYTTVSIIVLFTRELGQRSVAHLMRSYVDLKFSQSGATISIIAAVFSVLTGTPLALLIPVWNGYWDRVYESWGYDIPVTWSKREYWIASTGIVFLLVLWFTGYSMGYYRFSEAVALFTFFQLLPLRKNFFTEGVLDGAYILLHSGFIWLIFMSISLAGIVLPV